MLNENPKNEIAYKLTDKYEVKIYDAINSMSISKCSKIEVKAKVPLLAFDYNAIMVCLPSVTYKVEFEEAA